MRPRGPSPPESGGLADVCPGAFAGAFTNGITAASDTAAAASASIVLLRAGRIVTLTENRIGRR
jgi:hypothetical protein